MLWQPSGVANGLIFTGFVQQNMRQQMFRFRLSVLAEAVPLFCRNEAFIFAAKLNVLRLATVHAGREMIF